jgi:hypothetical protein
MHQPIKDPRLNCGSDCFDQVERQAVAIRSVGMKNPEARIKSASAGGQSTLALSYCVREVEQTVCWID